VRKVIGWILFGLGFPLTPAAIAVSDGLTGVKFYGVLFGVLIITGGWILAHPRKKE